ncbi:myotrophin-like isoform X2 [Zophobas morio]|uniref:myotrophin-like isoform X2 n=1 Tax=Zophobas morio TaxID=2755281 RepID=UPI003083A788
MECSKWSYKRGGTAFEGRTALHYAADYGQVEMISLLISKGAKVDAEDCYSMTPLCAAVLENHTKCAEVLIKNGADVHGKTPDGRTFLEAAKDDEMKKLLQN